eukprot:TRINITY_DN23888_c0_g1_i2.p1 TRINITY_DN23888_c0_g1~~TRINITY_DN23888_c0_g1_i2.p1  ORF type:complete len:761 (-),score=136.99 TRINITY_DN23888_c0_g1_i2:94-2376(-)
MVWVVAKGEIDEVSLAENGNAGGHRFCVAAWASNLVKEEVQRLKESGVKVLALPVTSCSRVRLLDTAGGKPDDKLFNRIIVSTSFDFSKVQQLVVGKQRHDTAECGGMSCVLGLLLVDTNMRSPALSFPFVFKDKDNPLTHWVLQNSKGEVRYIVQQTHSPPSTECTPEGESGRSEAVMSEAFTQKSGATDVDSGMSVTTSTTADGQKGKVDYRAALDFVWSAASVQERQELLTIKDSCLVLRLWANLLGLLASHKEKAKSKASSTPNAEEEEPESILAALGEDMALLRALQLVSEPGSHDRQLRFAAGCLSDGASFLALVERYCPGLLRSKSRWQRSPQDWIQLIEPPAKDMQRLQQRLAQLVEQRLWQLAADAAPTFDGSANKSGPKRKRQNGRQRQKTGAAQEPPQQLSKLGGDVKEREQEEDPADMCSDMDNEDDHLGSPSASPEESPTEKRASDSDDVPLHMEQAVQRTQNEHILEVTWNKKQVVLPELPLKSPGRRRFERQLSPAVNAGGRKGRASLVNPHPLVASWRRAHQAAKSGRGIDVRLDALAWRRLGCVIRGGSTDSAKASGEETLLLLGSKPCILCERMGSDSTDKVRQCLCVGAFERQVAEPVSSQDSDDSSPQPGDEAASLLRECFRHSGTPLCGVPEDQAAVPTRAWRPINPCVGATIQWRRRENAYWRLFWAANQRRRALEEADQMSLYDQHFEWPRTPSTLAEADLDFGMDGAVGPGRCVDAPPVPGSGFLHIGSARRWCIQ